MFSFYRNYIQRKGNYILKVLLERFYARFVDSKGIVCACARQILEVHVSAKTPLFTNGHSNIVEKY